MLALSLFLTQKNISTVSCQLLARLQPAPFWVSRLCIEEQCCIFVSWAWHNVNFELDTKLLNNVLTLYFVISSTMSCLPGCCQLLPQYLPCRWLGNCLETDISMMAMFCCLNLNKLDPPGQLLVCWDLLRHVCVNLNILWSWWWSWWWSWSW